MEETNNPRKAGALILNNLSMFNEAAILMEQEIETKVFEEIQAVIQKWVQENDCEGEMEWIDNENLRFAPKRWKLSSDERNLLPATFWLGHEDDSSSYNIADLCGCGQTRMGFYFGKDDGIKNKIWKNACQALPEASLQELENIDFRFQNEAGGLWFLPIILDSVKLATAYENDDYNDVMERLKQSLETIHKSLPIFDEILNQLPKDL